MTRKTTKITDAKWNFSKFPCRATNSPMEILLSRHKCLSLPCRIVTIGFMAGHIKREAYFAILLRVKLGHFRKMVYWSVVRICLYLACIRMQTRNTYRWGLFSFFHKPTESKPSHREKGVIKPHFSFLCSLQTLYYLTALFGLKVRK